MKRILILSDSLGLPRDNPELCSYEATWPILLKEYGNLIHQVSIGGATSGELLAQIFYHKMFKPDITIVQVGIVDCAPRFATKYELAILKKMSIAGKWLLKLMNKKSVRAFRNITYVSPRIFEYNISEILKRLDNSDLYFLSILPASADYEQVLPGINTNISKYNRILERVSGERYIDLSTIPLNGVMSDGHHLNAIGHAFIANELLIKLNNL